MINLTLGKLDIPRIIKVQLIKSHSLLFAGLCNHSGDLIALINGNDKTFELGVTILLSVAVSEGLQNRAI